MDADHWNAKHGKRRRQRAGGIAADDTLDMFDAPKKLPPPMTRTDDYETCVVAAKRVSSDADNLRYQVYYLFRKLGPMTAIECEEWEGFQKYAPSTVRKRCSELLHMGWLVEMGKKQITTKAGRRTQGILLAAVPGYHGYDD